MHFFAVFFLCAVCPTGLQTHSLKLLLLVTVGRDVFVGLTGPLSTPRYTIRSSGGMMTGENRKILRKTRPYRHFVHNKAYMDCLGCKIPAVSQLFHDGGNSSVLIGSASVVWNLSAENFLYFWYIKFGAHGPSSFKKPKVAFSGRSCSIYSHFIYELF